MTRRARHGAALALTLLASSCAGTYQQASERDLEVAERGLDPLRHGEDRAEALDLDGSLEGYVAAALRRSPVLRASFERWRASLHGVPRASRLPEPQITYAYFVRSVETRVGPQRHRLGLTQAFPWPSRLTAGADAASIAARARQRQFEAAALELQRRVVTAFYRLWLIDRTREVQRDQVEVLGALGASTRARVETSAASLADLSQVDLATSRARDVLEALDRSERAARAELLSAIGAPTDGAAPIRPREGQPAAGLPAEGRAELLDAALAHPRVEAPALMGESSEASARRAFADMLPSFVVGLEWIETGEARQDGVAGSGTDPLLVMLGVRLPLWQHAYGGEAAEARAMASAYEADAVAAATRSEGELDQALAAIGDADRRIALYRDTLVPQADAAYASVVGAYQTGRSTVAATLIAQRELLDLQLGLARARAAHATAWARLEEVVGRSVAAAAAPAEAPDAQESP